MTTISANDIIKMEYLSNCQSKDFTLYYKNNENFLDDHTVNIIIYFYAKINNLKIIINDQNVITYAYKNDIRLLYDLLNYRPKEINTIFYTASVENKVNIVKLIIKYFRDKITMSNLNAIKENIKSSEIENYIKYNFNDTANKKDILYNTFVITPDTNTQICIKYDNNAINNFLLKNEMPSEEITNIIEQIDTDKDFIIYLLRTYNYTKLLSIDNDLVLKVVKGNIHKLINESAINYINKHFKNTDMILYMYIIIFLRHMSVSEKIINMIEKIISEDDIIKFVSDVILFTDKIKKISNVLIRLYRKQKISDTTLSKIIDIIVLNEFEMDAITILCGLKNINKIYEMYDSNKLILGKIFHIALLTNHYEIINKIMKTISVQNTRPYSILRKEIITYRDKINLDGVVLLFKEINQPLYSINILYHLSYYIQSDKLIDLINLFNDNNLTKFLLTYSIKDNNYDLSQTLIEKYNIDTSYDLTNFTNAIENNSCDIIDLLFSHIVGDITTIFILVFKNACIKNNVHIINYLLITCSESYNIVKKNKLLHYICENSYLPIINIIKLHFPKYNFSYTSDNDYVINYKINEIEYNNMVNIADEQECPICYEPANVISTCNHRYCDCCVKQLNTNKRSSCPICRAEEITYKKVKIENKT